MAQPSCSARPLQPALPPRQRTAKATASACRSARNWRSFSLLKVADTNKDGKITKEEFAARQDALFAEIDKDKDGSITPKEMREYRQAKMEAFRAAHPRPEAADAKAGEGKGPEGKRAEREHGGRQGWGKHGGKGGAFAMMRMADTDENGQVSKAEFTATGEKMFERLDRNKDGVISIDDMPDRPFL